MMNAYLFKYATAFSCTAERLTSEKAAAAAAAM